MWMLTGLVLGLAIGGYFGFTLGRRPAGTPVVRVPARRRVTTVDLGDLEMRAKVRGAYDLAAVVDRLGKLRARVATLQSGESSDRLLELFDATASTCSRAYDVLVASRDLATQEAKDIVDAEQHQLVAEASNSIEALEHGVDRITAAAATEGVADDAAALSDLNTALERQLEVARRVDDAHA